MLYKKCSSQHLLRTMMLAALVAVPGAGCRQSARMAGDVPSRRKQIEPPEWLDAEWIAQAEVIRSGDVTLYYAGTADGEPLPGGRWAGKVKGQVAAQLSPRCLWFGKEIEILPPGDSVRCHGPSTTVITEGPTDLARYVAERRAAP